MQTVQVDLGDRSYPIYIGAGLLTSSNLILPHLKSGQVCVVTNDTVGPLYLQKLIGNLSDKDIARVELPDGETFKNLATLNQIFDELLSKRHNRNTTLIALGGGVVGDMCGFAAASYQRGVNFIQIPTTLLSQVDSSVGGKTGINHPLGKNMIGAFYQPQAVIIDIDLLSSLPSREISAGLAEIIKYGLLGDADFLEWLEQNVEKLVALDPEALIFAIRRSCENKAKIVSADEREGGVRALLNLGHTFGHAIETELGYGTWLHGEAVGAGMMIATELSRKLGWLCDADVDRVRDLLLRAGLPICAPGNMTINQFIEHMSVDKKVLDGSLRFVLLESLGKAVVTDKVPRVMLENVLQSSINEGLARSK